MAIVAKKDKFVNLKTRVKAEMLRRSGLGDLTTYGSVTYDYSVPVVSDGPAKMEHYDKIIVPLQQINPAIQNTAPDKPMKDLDILDANLTVFESTPRDSMVVNNCAANCSGVCVSACTTTCTSCTSCTNACTSCTGCTNACTSCTGCTNACTSCTGCTDACTNCTGTCVGGCTGCTNACTSCTGTCTGTCTNCTGTCSGCSGQCTSGCSGACRSDCRSV